MIDLIKILYKTGLFTLRGIVYIIQSVCNSGLNLMTILDFSRRINMDKSIINDDCETVSYIELYKRSFDFALKVRTNIQQDSKVVVICRNKISLLSVLFGLSCIGAKVYLINVDISRDQLSLFIDEHNIRNVIYDEEFGWLIDKSKNLNVCASISDLHKRTGLSYNKKLGLSFSSKIIVLTGGTGGKLKVAERRSSVFDFINPLTVLVKTLNLLNYNKVYIATPAYHGYGLASICISFFLGSNIYLRSRFDAQQSALLIDEEKIEVTTAVPLMINRLLQYEKKLDSLKCIISGGANLSPLIIDKVIEKLGDDLLYNLYGTTEVGFCILATPTDLQYSKFTIGKPIKGVNISIRRNDNTLVNNTEVGKICIICDWSLDKGKYIETGDLGYKDELGYIYLKGRCDDMIVSGGENVYPTDIESVLLKHEAIVEAIAIGIDDTEFGQRLSAYIVVSDNSITTSDILLWLKDRVARFQMPKQIVIVDAIPTTSIGKYNKKAFVVK